MGVKQCHRPPIWELFVPPINMLKLGMVYDIVLPTLHNNTSYTIPMGFPRKHYITGWWFQPFFIFHDIWDNPSH